MMMKVMMDLKEAVLMTPLNRVPLQALTEALVGVQYTSLGEEKGPGKVLLPQSISLFMIITLLGRKLSQCPFGQ